ncbi:unnamed protein product [Alopecurus aequalis]
MEKKDLLGVRTKPVAAKPRRRKAAAAGGAGGGRGLAKAIADYLASDSYMYAPLVADPQPQPQTTPPPAATASPAPPSPCIIVIRVILYSTTFEAQLPAISLEKEVYLVQKYRGSWQGTYAAS